MRMKLTQHEILSMVNDCPDSLSIINRHIRRLTPIETWIKKEKNLVHMRYNDWEQIGSKIMIDGYWAEEMRHLKRLRYLKQAITTKGEVSNGYPTQEEINKAKEVPIETITDFHRIKRTSKGFIAVCPWHSGGQEKTSSFNVRSNKFNCFGCNEKGDSIAFIQKEKGLSFIQAVKWLNKL